MPKAGPGVGYVATLLSLIMRSCFVLIHICLLLNYKNNLYETFSLTLGHICSCQKGSDPMDKRSPWVGIVWTFE